ncbi:glucose 1-dehydrogenase [Microvirga puerhi]|uniref:Glucose 1-dehydrogenase n=1 Tax=Microvirga puerhi TaxID=2876078 RepID=A0ABS7VIJ9_9HYPH|nr:glucose 1-dehydrogenase [Microvirga puerhi]MBZ6074798.1 glucose 1-dehydrogenase [Microvirga puerhi]
MASQRPIVLITGASRGIGAAVAQLAAQRGYDVAINYRSERDAAELVARVCRDAGAAAVICQGDMAVSADVIRVFDEAQAGLGPVSHVVNNAGITGRSSRLESASDETIRACIDINVLGALWVAREAARRLSKENGGPGGSIVNISSVASRLGSAGEYVWYAASKAAVDALTIGLSQELAGQGVRVNAVSPGITRTEIHEKSTGDAERVERFRAKIPMNRIGEPEEIAEAILFLMSDAASYITGTNVSVSGGR